MPASVIRENRLPVNSDRVSAHGGLTAGRPIKTAPGGKHVRPSVAIKFAGANLLFAAVTIISLGRGGGGEKCKH